MAFSGLGSGVLGDPYQITTWAQFNEIQNELTAHYLLMNDINANHTNSNVTSAFAGNFNGGGKTINNARTLFYCTDGTVTDLSITSSNTGSSFHFGSSSVLNSGSTFTDITIISTFTAYSSYPSAFGGKFQNCTIENITIKSNIKAIFVTYLNNCTVNNLLISSYESIEFGGANFNQSSFAILSSTFNNCKFILLNKVNSIFCPGPQSSTFNTCVFYGGKSFIQNYNNWDTNKKNYFNNCSFIPDYEINKTGSVNTQTFVLGFTTSEFNKCYFGGNIKIYHTNFSNGSYPYYKFIYSETLAKMTDCHIAINIITTWDNTPTNITHSIAPEQTASAPVRCFIDTTVTGFTSPGLTVKNGTNVFLNRDKITEGVTKTANFTLLTTAQTKTQSNFTNFDFDTVWEIQDGISSPKLRNVAYDVDEYLPPIELVSLSLARVSTTTEKATIVVPRKLSDSSTLNCYVSNDPDNIVLPENEVAVTKISDLQYESVFAVPEGNFYVIARYELADYNHSLQSSAYHYSIDQITTIVKNITAPNFHVFSTPQMIGIHGALVHNGYYYGSARGFGGIAGESICKVNVTDFSDRLFTKIFKNKTNQLDLLTGFEQIVYCKGFIWAITHVGTSATNPNLIRIDPTTLDYIVFNYYVVEGLGHYQPIGTDGEFLYIHSNEKVIKLNCDLLIGAFSEYGYTGISDVPLPENTILGSCDVLIQNGVRSYVHSIQIDSSYIYLACTSNALTNGITAEGLNTYHFQKINKHTMITVGDVPIPKCTDDMTQNEKYVFLAPELSDTELDIYGKDWGVFAIRKKTLEIRYLKALHQEFHTPNESDRNCYGIHYFGDYMAVQLVNSKKTVVIDTANVDLWNEEFPIGGATVAVFRFTIDGVALGEAPNELLTTEDGNIIANTFATNNTQLFKFSDENISFLYPPVVQTVLIQSLINSTTIGGTILSSGSSDVTMIALRYGINSNNLDQIISFENPSINFQSVLNLAPGIYYFQAYAANSVGTSYGAIVPFVVGNTVILSHDSAGAAASLRNNNCGHAVRFCKRAWGVADGTIGSATDADGNTYKTVVINEIEWAAEDLKTALYNNAEVIPEIQDNTAWSTTTDGARTYYNNILPT